MIFEMPKCGGCRTCEVACSFHHAGKFRPSISSIQIVDKEDVGGYSVVLLEKNEGDHLACDGCQALEVPACVEYCKEMDDLGLLLREFSEKRKQGKVKSGGKNS